MRSSRGRLAPLVCAALTVAACTGAGNLPTTPSPTPTPPVDLGIPANCHVAMHADGAATGPTEYWGWGSFGLDADVYLYLGIEGEDGPDAGVLRIDVAETPIAKLTLVEDMTLYEMVTHPTRPIGIPYVSSEGAGTASAGADRVDVDLTLEVVPGTVDRPPIHLVGTATCTEFGFGT